jgi:transcriptional regulator with XRE-family HTH domain
MPLDTGGVADSSPGHGEGRDWLDSATHEPTLQSGADIGEALRLIREHRGLSLDNLAEATRVRASFLAALEDLRLDKLPSRPFTIGYIRAYAEALGLDSESAVERFKADEPVLDETLHAPIGVEDERDPRLTSLMVGACVIIAAIFMWNIAQRGMVEAAPPPPTASEMAASKALVALRKGPIELGAPLPPPVESTTPPPYETPGLADAKLAEDGRLVLEGKPKPLDNLADPPDIGKLPPVFQKKGAVFGAPANQPSTVTVQALRSASLIVRGQDGSVYFARELAPGEAFRAPQAGGLILEVSTPTAFQVFVGGQSKGVLPANQASVSGLAGG